MAARAFGADRVFFVTNGTSTSNKMAVQALLAPGDIAIVDRNCHKSHHYGMVLAGAQPLYVEAFPMTEYSMYGAVPLQHDQAGAAEPAKADGRLRPRQDARPDQLHLRRPHLQHAPGDGGMPGHQAGPDLPVGRSLVRLCALLAVPAAAHRDGRRQRHRGLDARSEIGRRPMRSSRAELGENPSDEMLLKTRLIPDPRKVKLRVYQTNSTHKSMSALRQGSMLLVKDVEFHTVEAAIQGGGVHPRLDQPEPAADRQPRRGAPPDGAGGLWPGRTTRSRSRSRSARRSRNIR